ncbi:hypothetical protein [Streptomyces sp. NPDC047061]|uniref:hypothetical protein n=1 Tax=Streptomyces sp. NPDC047061 TaxID=3154605 RepID=UPI0033CC757B
MADQSSDAAELFLPAKISSDPPFSSGLVRPDLSWAARQLGLTPVTAERTWMDLTGVYVIAREYLEEAERARGRALDCAAWMDVLLAKYSCEQYLCALAALNHATTRDDLLQSYLQRFLIRLAPDAGLRLQAALAGSVDGQRRRFLARQIVLRAMRAVMLADRNAGVATPDAEISTALAPLGLETCAVLLIHLAADSLSSQRPPGEPLLGGTAQSLAMEMIANNLFNEAEDPGDLLARHRLLWTRYSDNIPTARQHPLEMLEEATGLTLNDITALGFAYNSGIMTHLPDAPVAMQAFTGIGIDHAVVERFLGRFAIEADDLAAQLRDCPLPWQMLPIQNRPLLRLGEHIVVLDERYLHERVTQGLFWLVHDHERDQYGERARLHWTQAYAEMVERRVKDQLRRLAPHVLGGGSSFFTEVDLARAFPGSKSADVGLDFGSSTVLVEVVSATVGVAAREHGDIAAFRRDTEKVVVKKARQLSQSALNLLADPQPASSPLGKVSAKEVFPVAVRGGHYPVNPITRRYLEEEWFTTEGLFAHPRIRDLALLDLEELEACEALNRHRHLTLPQILAGWQTSPYRDGSLRSHLVLTYGGQEIGRPQDIEDALHETTTMIAQRLGFSPTDDNSQPEGSQDESGEIA